ncbi:MAG: LysM peptidoglycan-binding domain-containing protein [Oscillospiraceae bacterium]|nr:LysM peptidoglycan-binding domain-containing protein [Oscillospiraceae bacterium]
MDRNIIALALRRAGAQTLQEFQRQRGLYPSGEEDILTMEQLMPYILGYRRYMIKPGDSYSSIARQFSTTVGAISTANPNANPGRLRPGQYVIVPLGFSVVPTDIPFTSELLSLCVEGLTMRYPFLSSRRIATTAYGRPVTLLKLGEGRRSVLYNGSHHANEWITTPVLMKFLEEYAKAVSRNGRLWDRDATALFRRTQLYIVPMVNPDGVDLVTGAIAEGSLEYEAAQSIAARYPAVPFPDGWKANLSGVDLNLNYPAGWEQAKENKYALGYDRPAPRDFVGFSPLDQPETIAMVQLTKQTSPGLTLSYHTQGEVIYWKFMNIEVPGGRQIGEAFARSSGYELEDTPFASGFAGYKDWFIQEYNRPGYTVEVGMGSNPLPLDQFDQIYRDNLGILVQGLYL